MIKAGDTVARRAKNALFSDCQFAKKVESVSKVYLRKQARHIDIVKLEGYNEYIDLDYVRLTTPEEVEQANAVLKSIKYLQELTEIEGADPCVSTYSGHPKVVQKNEITAFHAAYSMSMRDGTTGMIIYICPKCNGLHLGRNVDG